MRNSNLKKIVYSAISKQKFSSQNSEKNFINRILTGVLLYKTLSMLLSANSIPGDNFQTTADNYALTYKNISESLEKKFISYKEISDAIKNFKLNSFLDINEIQIDKIYNLYCDKTELKEFDTHYFSPFMYRVKKLTESENNRLKETHFNVIVPIVKYYKTFFGINENKVYTENLSSESVGGYIRFSIEGIFSSQIFSDIKKDLMNVKKFIYSFKMGENNTVELIIK